MTDSATSITDTLAQLLPAEHDRLVRLCAHLTGDAVAAEDLAQETMLVAWRKRAHLFDAAGTSYWLSAIARNVCRSWRRAQLQVPSPMTDDIVDAATNVAADVELELERDEIALLLDRALALLAPDVRALLIQHYVDELPQAELAARLGLNDNALAVRLHRGKLSLRRALTTHFPTEAATFGLIEASDGGWHETRMWCNYCGQHHMQAKWDRARSAMHLRCPGCGDLVEAVGQHVEDAKTFRPCYTHVLALSHEHYRRDTGSTTCWHCGRELKIEFGVPPHLPWLHGMIYAYCPTCGKGSAESWQSLTLSLPEVRDFWRAHPRLRSLPNREIDAEGGPAVVAGYESVVDAARIEVVTLLDGLRVLHIGKQ